MTTSTIWGIPFVSSQEADFFTTINEQIVMLEALHTPVESVGDNAPPSSSDLSIGEAFIVGAAPTGAWSGKANLIAYYSAGGWRFLPGNNSEGSQIPIGTAHDGKRVFNKEDQMWYEWNGSAWSSTGSGP